MNPAGTSKFGRWLTVSDRSTWQRSAMRTVLAIASGKSPKTAAISSARLQIELVAVVAEPVRVVDRLAGADAQQDVVRPMIRVLQVVDVVGADERQVEVARDRRQPDVHDALVVDALVLHLEEEVAGAEDVAVGRRRVQRLRLLLGADARRDFALEAAAEADEARRVRRQQFLVDARLVVEALRCIPTRRA